jgi:hypothetical protein
MTRDDLIPLLEQADISQEVWFEHHRSIERFAALVAAAEREACAKLCEKEQFELTQDVSGKNGLQHFDAGCRSCAEMIRARGEV